MGKQTTRDAALSRLFGNTEVSPAEAVEADAEIEAPKALPARSESRPVEKRKPKTSKPRGEGRGGPKATAPDMPAGKATTDAVAASGYIGLGKYSRSDGVVERITPYVRPDQAEALRVAVARKNDPRGRDISQIIQSLLDEAGYQL